MAWNKQVNHSQILKELKKLLPVICHILVVFRYIDKFDLSAQYAATITMMIYSMTSICLKNKMFDNPPCV